MKNPRDSTELEGLAHLIHGIWCMTKNNKCVLQIILR